jgi:transcriptional regulator with XRE-family HTH domain
MGTIRQIDPGFGPRIKRRREELGVTQAALAARIGVTTLTVSKWECGRQTPSMYINELATALAVPTSYIIRGGKNAVKPPAPPPHDFALAEGLNDKWAILRKELNKKIAEAQALESLSASPPGSTAESVVRNLVARMPRCKLDAYPHMGIAAADEQEGRSWEEGQSDPGTLSGADAIEPRVITVRGSSAEELARDGQQCVIDVACFNTAPGDLCVVLTRDGNLRLKRKAKDRGKLRVYNSINRDFPAFEVPAREVLSEFPVVTVLLKSKTTSPIETLNEGFPT